MTINQKTCYFLLSLFLISTSVLFAEKTPSDLFLISSVQDNPVFITALQNKEDKPYLEKIKTRYLIEAIRRSPLTFVRNNETHDGRKAASHISWKYLRVIGRKQNVRDFIDKIASQSLRTELPYLVKTAKGETYPLRDTLYNELERLEQSL